jgi:hypothetical protein
VDLERSVNGYFPAALQALAVRAIYVANSAHVATAVRANGQTTVQATRAACRLLGAS